MSTIDEEAPIMGRAVVTYERGAGDVSAAGGTEYQIVAPLNIPFVSAAPGFDRVAECRPEMFLTVFGVETIDIGRLDRLPQLVRIET